MVSNLCQEFGSKNRHELLPTTGNKMSSGGQQSAAGGLFTTEIVMIVSLVLMVSLCAVALLVLVGLVVGIIIIMKSGERDTVSSAREGWINRRSDKDEQGW